MEFHAPEIKTFIDGRADLFIHSGIFDDYLKAEGLSSSFEVLDKYGIQYVFMQPHEPMVYMLEHSAGWKAIYSDKVAVLLERSPRPGN
jgi:Fe-S oxidoreductase